MACFSDCLPSFLQFSQRVSNEPSIVSIDHNYAKPWSSHPDASNARPRRMLFMEPSQRPHSSESTKEEVECIDVDGEGSPSVPLYDVPQSKTLMNDCEQHTALLGPEFTEMKDDWEDHIAIIRTTWTVFQNRIFAKVMRVLQSDHLARLTIQKTQNEPVQRRLQIDKAAKRVRYAFANVNWDVSLILWLHNLFLEKLRGPLLISYLEVLQTLKEKIPSLIECLIDGTVCKTGGLTKESLSVLLKRTWDPVISNVNQQKYKKLPGNPLLIVVSNVPSSSNILAMKRYKSWQHQLASMGKVLNIVPVSSSVSVADCVENMVASTRSKILEMKGHFPGRVIVLIGFHVGALIATQVALMEQVHAVVCIGYPILGVNGSRGDIDESVYNTKTPTLFVVGQHASSLNLDTLEDIREKLRVETGLVVVGGADDQLRMSRAKKKACSVTQCLVDRCIVDEITDFLGSTLSQAIIQPEMIEEADPLKKTPRKRKLKEAGLAVGSQTSELLKQVTSKQFKKALKYPKQDPLLSSASSTAADTLAIEIPRTSPNSPLQIKPSKNSLPKKHCKGTSKPMSGKRPLLHLKLQSSKARNPLPSLSKIEEAAAIASAPELSNLLQSMKPTLPASFVAPKISPSPPPTSTVTTLPLTSPEKSDPVASNLLKASSSDEDPSTSKSLASSLRVESDNNTKNLLLAKQLPSTTDDTGDSKQQTQILIHSCSSSQPISIPLSLTIGSKVLKSVSNLGRLTPLLENFPASSAESMIRLQSSAAPQTTMANFSETLQSPSKSTSPISVKPSGIPESQSPIASVISIGSDTVQMKETPPSITSAPGTVSIDLGQLATSNNIVMKFGNSSKISLIPSLKQVTPVTASHQDRAVPSSSLSLPADGSAKPVPMCISVASKTTSSILATSLKPQPIQLASKYVSKSGDLSPKPSGKSLTLLSSSQLKPSTTNPSFIALKLSSSVSPPTLNEVEANHGKSLTSHSDGGVGTNVSLALKSLCNISSSNVSSSPKIVLSSPGQTEFLSTATSSEKKSPSSSLLLTTGITSRPVPSVSSMSCGGPLVLNNKSSCTSVFASSSMALSKLMLGTGVETLGQVSSLLESSPVTMGEHSQTAASESSLQGANRNETLCSQAAPTSSPQGQASAFRASKSTFSSYASLSKPVLPTVASTRTRRIKTPKQYDL